MLVSDQKELEVDLILKKKNMASSCCDWTRQVTVDTKGNRLSFGTALEKSCRIWLQMNSRDGKNRRAKYNASFFFNMKISIRFPDWKAFGKMFHLPSRRIPQLPVLTLLKLDIEWTNLGERECNVRHQLVYNGSSHYDTSLACVTECCSVIWSSI